MKFLFIFFILLPAWAGSANANESKRVYSRRQDYNYALRGKMLIDVSTKRSSIWLSVDLMRIQTVVLTNRELMVMHMVGPVA